MDQLLAFWQLFAALGWLPDWSAPTWIGSALLANVGLDLVAARRLFRGYVFATHMDKFRRSTPTQRLTKLQWALGGDTGLAAIFWDLYCQVSYSKYFWDLPREVTLSNRMTRYLEGPDCRNRRITQFIERETGINFFDYRGKHL